ncbi:MAG: glycosyltransferase, partial [Oscillospiraceae bacterium]
IHIQQEFGLGLAGIKCSRKLNIPLIYTLHTMYDDYIYYVAPRPFTWAVKKISHRYIKLVARRADIITGPSKKCADYLRAAGVKRRVRVIPNSVEVEKYGENKTTLEQRAAVREKLQIPRDAFVACFCGRVGREKGIDELLSLWRSQTGENAYLVIMGDGPEREELTLESESLGLGKRVKFTGALPHDELIPYYAMCDIYATASLSEMYSISMLEAQASGLFVVQKLDPENVCQIKDGVNGKTFVTDREFGGILDSLQALTPSQRAELKFTVRDSVKDRNPDTIAKYLLDLYQLAIERRKKGITFRQLREDTE